MKTKIKQEKGITLIALVVTIVVLLILAGVSVNALFGNSGIIEKAKEAQNAMNMAKENELLVRIPADQKFFRETTTGKVVVMGRKTLESFPNGLPLKNRTNIVLTHDHTYKVPGAVVVHDMDELHEELKKYDSQDIYVIGGETIYRQLLDECDVAHITKIDYAYDADAYFPNLDERPEWKITADSEEQTYFDLEYYFYRYERVK